MILTGLQKSTDAVAAVAGVAAVDTTLVAAPGANFRVKIISLHVTLDVGAAGRVQFRGRDGTTGIVFGVMSVGPNQPSDHVYFGEGGYAIADNEALQVRSIASVAAQNVVYVATYVVEYIGA